MIKKSTRKNVKVEVMEGGGASECWLYFIGLPSNDCNAIQIFLIVNGHLHHHALRLRLGCLCSQWWPCCNQWSSSNSVITSVWGFLWCFILYENHPEIMKLFSLNILSLKYFQWIYNNCLLWLQVCDQILYWEESYQTPLIISLPTLPGHRTSSILSERHTLKYTRYNQYNKLL